MSLEQILVTEGYLIYLILFFALMGGALGLPIPEDIPLIAAGVFAARHSADPILMFGICYIAVVLGDLIIFSAGRRFGSALFSKPWFRRKLNPRRIKRFKLGLERKSLLTIFVARHLFYLRMVTFLACGAVKMSYARFLIADCLAALISVPLMMCLGFLAAEHYEELHENLEFIFVFVGLVVLGFLIPYLRRLRRGPSPLSR